LIDYQDSLQNLNNTGAYIDGIKKIKAAGWLGKGRLFVGKETDGD
jgi:hypothetical protein